MGADVAYLLDTNVVLHGTRENSPFSAAVEAQFALTASRFRPAICEVTVAEMLAFARSWGEARRARLERVIDELLVLPIARREIHRRWAELHDHARTRGLPVQHGHNDLWIAATTHVAGLRLLSADGAAFLPLRGTEWLDVIVLDARTGLIIP